MGTLYRAILPWEHYIRAVRLYICVNIIYSCGATDTAVEIYRAMGLYSCVNIIQSYGVIQLSEHYIQLWGY